MPNQDVPLKTANAIIAKKLLGIRVGYEILPETLHYLLTSLNCDGDGNCTLRPTIFCLFFFLKAKYLATFLAQPGIIPGYSVHPSQTLCGNTFLSVPMRVHIPPHS